MNRRSFLSSSLAAGAVLGTGVIAVAQNAYPAAGTPVPPPTAPEPKRPAALEATMVRDFVGAGHRNLPKVKELLAAQPLLLDAAWDLGGGDWETAIGAASHVGNRPIARYLLEQGARPDVFCAAMLGETDYVTSLMRFSPASAHARGPHGYMLLYHIGYSGQVAMAEAVGRHVKEPGHFNQALLSSVLSGHPDLVAWLLRHGVSDVNMRGPGGKTPLDLAVERKHGEIERLLRAAGALSASALPDSAPKGA
jgi:hypothetical protein